MALKLTVSKAVFDKLPEALQGEYYADGDNYKLDVAGMPNIDALTAAKDDAVKARREAEERARNVEARVNEVTKELDETRSSFETKMAEQLGEKEAALTKANAFVNNTLVKSVASDIANDISTAPSIMSEFIAKRISVDMSGDEPKTVFLDASGKPSKLTADELKAEFAADKNFAPIVKVNRASGGKSPLNPNPQQGFNPQSQQSNTDIPLADMSVEQLAARFALPNEK